MFRIWQVDDHIIIPSGIHMSRRNEPGLRGWLIIDNCRRDILGVFSRPVWFGEDIITAFKRNEQAIILSGRDKFFRIYETIWFCCHIKHCANRFKIPKAVARSLYVDCSKISEWILPGNQDLFAELRHRNFWKRVLSKSRFLQKKKIWIE